MNTKVILCILLLGAILVAGCSTSGGSYNAPPTGGAVAGGGGCGRFSGTDSAECIIVEETVPIQAAPGF